MKNQSYAQLQEIGIVYQKTLGETLFGLGSPPILVVTQGGGRYFNDGVSGDFRFIGNHPEVTQEIHGEYYREYLRAIREEQKATLSTLEKLSEEPVTGIREFNAIAERSSRQIYLLELTISESLSFSMHQLGLVSDYQEVLETQRNIVARLGGIMDTF